MESRRAREGIVALTNWEEATLHYKIGSLIRGGRSTLFPISKPRYLLGQYVRIRVVRVVPLTKWPYHTGSGSRHYGIGIWSLMQVGMPYPIPWGRPDRCGHVDIVGVHAFTPDKGYYRVGGVWVLFGSEWRVTRASDSPVPLGYCIFVVANVAIWIRDGIGS